MSAALTPWRRNFTLMEPFRQEMEDLVHRFFGEDEGNGHLAKAWAPRVDMDESEKEITVKADVPGVDPKAVEITVENGMLTIRGEKREEKEEKKNYHRVERFAGSFYRSIPLPPAADADRVSASSAHGV